MARIVREYADAGIQFDERRILNVVDSLQAIVEEQRVVDAEPSLTVGDGHDLVDDSDPAYIASDSL